MHKCKFTSSSYSFIYTIQVLVLSLCQMQKEALIDIFLLKLTTFII